MEWRPVLSFCIIFITIKIYSSAVCSKKVSIGGYRSTQYYCCTHSFMLNGQCKECQTGFYSEPGDRRCTPCPSNFFGYRCIGECSCKESERCNNVIGCIPYSANPHLRFLNQTDIHTIEGQEGKGLDISCTSVTREFITTLNLEVNGSIIAIGDNQSVNYSFTPYRTDHLTKYICVDSKQSWIMIEVTLFIRYPPAYKGPLTNEAIICDCDGNPTMYDVHRFNQTSKYGDLVRAVNMGNATFSLTPEPFPYQNNGIYTCVASNGIPDTNGKLLQIWSTNIRYEGTPVFSPDNRNLKTGELGHSLSMSFYIYSYPEVEKVYLERVGMNSTHSQKIKHYNISKSMLRYTEYNNILGIQGYEILIESEILDIDDFHTYRITAQNRLGKTNYYFEIIQNQNFPLDKRKRIYFMILCILAVILFVYVLSTLIWICVKHIKSREKINHNVEEHHTYHMYEEIGSISYRTARVIRPSETNDNQAQNRTEHHAVGSLTGANTRSAGGSTTELNFDVPDDGLDLRDVTEVEGQRLSVSSSDINMANTYQLRIPSLMIQKEENTPYCNQTNKNTHTAPPRQQQSQTSNDSDSESSHMVDNASDGYENPYQNAFQDQPESHQYTQITLQRNTSISYGGNLQLTDVNTTEFNANILEDDFQQFDITELQMQCITMDDMNLYCADFTLTPCTVIPSMQNLVHDNHALCNKSPNIASYSDEKSQQSDDSDSGSSNNVIEGNVGDEYENPYQMILQDPAESHLYTEIITQRHSGTSSTESDKSEEQQIGMGSTKKEEYINLQL